MKQTALSIFLFFLPMVASADAINIDGIYYNLTKKVQEAQVTKPTSGKYAGEIIIPPNIEYEGVVYEVTSIDAGAFFDCIFLFSVTIGNNVKSIGNEAFARCRFLNSVFFGDGVTSIGGLAFHDCESLESLSIPDGVTYIGNGAFVWCSGLTTLTIPNSVSYIGESAFHGCSRLTSITIPNSLEDIRSQTFQDCTGLTSVIIPNSVKTISNNAFNGCNNLASVKIPDSVTLIDWQAFSGCKSLTSITIGKNIKTIRHYAFSDCQNLTDVYCYADELPETSENTFSGSYIEYATLHVPSATIERYKAMAPWNMFASFKTIDGEDVQVKKCEKPTISYSNGEISFSCETEDVNFVSSISDSDVKNYTVAKIPLNVTYTVSVHATKAGYQDSDETTATLCWINAEPQTEGITNGVANVRAHAVLILSQDGIIDIEGITDEQFITIYSVSGQMIGSAKAYGGHLRVPTNLRKGEIAIVKIGEKSVKIVM